MRIIPLLSAVLAGLLLFAEPALAAPAAEPSSPRQRIEVAFVLDTTGSMAQLIDGAKRKIWSIANTIVDKNPEAEIHFGLVAYRDLGDEYVTKHFPLTTDIQSIYAELLTFRAAGGGDTPESVNEALDVAVTRLGWSDAGQTAGQMSGQTAGRTSRILFLVGDAPPHMDYPQDRKYPEVIKEAVSKGIIVNTVQAGNMQSTKKFWQEMAGLGNGQYHAIPQDGGRIIIIETPYDDQIRLIQIELNKTVIPYGSRDRRQMVENKKSMAESAAPAEAADMSSYVNKSSGGKAGITGEGDLVADAESGKARLAAVPRDQLPPALQKMTAAELENHVREQAANRERLSGRLKDLVLQRDQFIRERQAEQTAGKPDADSFDASVARTLESQIR